MKAETLRFLESKGYAVPFFYTIPGNYFQRLLGRDLSRFYNEFRDGNFKTVESKIDKLFNDLDMIQVENHLKSKMSTLKGNSALVARSSATLEDGKYRSFAGMFKSYLNVEPRDLIEKVKLIYLSVFSSQVFHYFQSHELKVDNFEMEVIIQEFVNAECSGVAFSIDPIKSSFLSVSAIYGLGESLMSGELTGDYYLIDRINENVIQAKTGKISEIQTKRQNGSELIKNSNYEPVLSNNQLKDIRKLILDLEQEMKYLIDLEFCFYEDKLYIVQVRPISSIPNQGFRSRTFDNSNIIESFKGATTPLTYSIAKRSYYIVYYRFLQEVGVSKNVLNHHQSIFDNLLGFLYGNIYYNLDSWHTGLKLLPAYRYNKSYMDQMMGVQQAYNDQTLEVSSFEEDNEKELGWFSRNVTRHFINLKLSLNIWKLHRRRKKEVLLFRKNFDKRMEYVNQFEIGKLNLDELLQIDDFIYEQITKQWFAPILNDFCLMIYFGVFRSMNNKWLKTPKYNEMLAGNLSMLSVKPTKDLLVLAQLFKSSKIDMNNSTDTQLLEHIKNHPKSDLTITYNKFIKEFGDRTFDELKLETLNLEDDPSYIFNMIRYFHDNDSSTTIDLFSTSQANERRRNEEKIYSEVPKLLKRYFYKKFHKLAKIAITDREEMRFARTRIFGLARKLFYRVGEILFDKKVIDAPRDIFFLSINEIRDFGTGASLNQDLKLLIKHRKDEYEYHKTIELPNRIITFGAVPLDLDRYVNTSMKYDDATESNVSLTGIGCYEGIITGKVAKLISPHDKIPFGARILVTERTDPGWTPLFIHMDAILVERGSPLSHSAIVAREFGIPTIVGISGLMRKIKDGSTVTIDGAKGTVVIEAEVN